ncbi:membrane hypothetical protein [Nostocoides japonicum T1-X7]|uniref:Integral membrane protein n=1 Tax=Nostocoides japonicum T1-X7 TaxID=1194083 RepID=A0A077LTA2_9MICO|nr:hypothetical protein [Tetrasphaera japonica]CCH76331.1 membrane hypothetical protein [Tetrasphaera japonica T1-X7]
MRLERLAPLTGPLGLAAIIAALASDTLPGGDVTDADLATYTQTHGYGTWLLMGVGFGVGGVLLLVFAAVLATRLERAGAGPVATRIAQVAGTAWGTLALAAGACWSAAPMAHLFLSPRPPTAAVYNLFGGLSYGILVLFCALAAATLAAAVTAVALRTSLLPRWLAVVGVPATLLMLANPLLPMAVITLWFTAVAICLALREPAKDPVTGAAIMAGAVA